MAVAVEFGSCTQCNENNAKSTESCRRCGAPLPWSKVVKALAKGQGVGLQGASRLSSAPALSFPTFSMDSLEGAGGIIVQTIGTLMVAGAFLYYLAVVFNVVGYVRGPGWIGLVVGRLLWKAGRKMSAD